MLSAGIQLFGLKMNVNLLQTGLRLKTRLSLYLVLTLTKKKNNIKKKKSNPPQCPITM